MKKKKLWSLVLVIVMVLSMMPANLKMRKVEAAATGTRIVGYLPSYRMYAVDTVDFSAMTHCILSFMTYGNGTLTSGFLDSDAKKIVAKCHENGTKAMIAIGGWNGFDASGDPLGTAEKRTAFINQVMDYVNTYNLDGVDIDIELTDSKIWNNYDAFISELSGRLKKDGKLLTMAVSQWFTDSMQTSTYQYFDFLNLMSYDYNMSGTAEVAPWSQIYGMVEYYGSKGVSNDKLVIGVPFYGYGSGGTAYTYAQMVEKDSSNADKDFADGVYYNGMSTIKAKAEYSKKYGGTMIWEIGQDSLGDKSLLKVIKDTLADTVGGDASDSEEETLEYMTLTDGDYYLSSANENKIVTVPDSGSGTLAATKSSYTGAAEKFTITNNADGTVSLKSAVNGLYVCSEVGESGQLVARSESVDDWEKFYLVKVSDNDMQCALKAVANGLYVSADFNNGGALKATSNSIDGSWEVFILTTAPNEVTTEEDSDKNQQDSTENTGGDGQPGSTEETGEVGQTGSTEEIGGNGQLGSTEETGGNGQSGNTEETGENGQPGSTEETGGDGQPGSSEETGENGQPGSSEETEGNGQPGNMEENNGTGQQGGTGDNTGSGLEKDSSLPVPFDLLIDTRMDNMIGIMWGNNGVVDATYNVYVNGELALNQVGMGYHLIENVTAGTHSVGVSLVKDSKESNCTEQQATVTGEVIADGIGSGNHTDDSETNVDINVGGDTGDIEDTGNSGNTCDKDDVDNSDDTGSSEDVDNSDNTGNNEDVDNTGDSVEDTDNGGNTSDSENADNGGNAGNSADTDNGDNTGDNEDANNSGNGDNNANASVQDHTTAQSVIGLIQAIGTVTNDSKQAIDSARDAYNALTESQKTYVENYYMLEQAEADFAKLQEEQNTGEDENRDPDDEGNQNASSDGNQNIGETGNQNTGNSDNQNSGNDANRNGGNNNNQNAGATTSQTSGTNANAAVNLPSNVEMDMLRVGDIFEVMNICYQITSMDGNDSSVTLLKTTNLSIKKLTIPKSVRYKGVTYKVTLIGNNAFRNCKKLENVTIGKNVTSIGKAAFKGCKKLKVVTMKSKMINEIGTKAFSGISSSARIKTGSTKMVKKYQKLLKNKVPAKVIIEK